VGAGAAGAMLSARGRCDSEGVYHPHSRDDGLRTNTPLSRLVLDGQAMRELCQVLNEADFTMCVRARDLSFTVCVCACVCVCAASHVPC
jgi:hypothetical protein